MLKVFIYTEPYVNAMKKNFSSGSRIKLEFTVVEKFNP